MMGSFLKYSKIEKNWFNASLKHNQDKYFLNVLDYIVKRFYLYIMNCNQPDSLYIWIGIRNDELDEDVYVGTLDYTDYNDKKGYYLTLCDDLIYTPNEMHKYRQLNEEGSIINSWEETNHILVSEGNYDLITEKLEHIIHRYKMFCNEFRKDTIKGIFKND